MDFGNLKNEDEEKYIRSMVETLIAKKCKEFNLSQNKIKEHQDWAVRGIIECQNYFKTHADISAVSLREVKRFCVFYEWFIPYLLMKVEDPHYQNETLFTIVENKIKVYKKQKVKNPKKFFKNICWQENYMEALAW